MANNNSKKKIVIHFYMTVPVSDELWDELWEENNYNAIREISNKYGFLLMTDKEAKKVPEGTPLISRISDFDTREEFYLA